MGEGSAPLTPGPGEFTTSNDSVTTVVATNKTMKIGYLINQYPAISHTFIKNEILALEDRGLEVHRIAIRGWNIAAVDPADAIEKGRTTYLLRDGLLGLMAAAILALARHPVRASRALFRALELGRKGDKSAFHHLAYFAEACRLRQVAADLGLQHIHAHFGSNSAEVAMLARSMGGPPFSFTVHGPEEFDKRSSLKIAEKVRAASFVVAVSSFGRSQLYRICRLGDWDKVRIVHCGLGPDYLDAPRTPVPAGRRLLCVGRLCEQKGQLILIRACDLLARRGVPFELVVVGDGEMREVIETEIAHRKLGDQVRLVGSQSPEAIRAILAGSRGLVLPSFAEGLPVVIMEAMAMRRPVVSTYIAGIPELVRDGSEGYLVCAGDEASLADAMERLLALDEAEFTRFGENAHRRVTERHSAATEAAKLASLFDASIG